MENSEPPPKPAVPAKSVGGAASKTVLPKAEKPPAKPEKKAPPKPGLKKTPPVVQTLPIKKRAQAGTKPARPVKELKKTVKSRGSKKFRVLKYALAGIVLIVAILALAGFFLASRQPPPEKVAATPETHIIDKPPAKPSEPEPASPPPASSPAAPEPPAAPAETVSATVPAEPEKTITPSAELDPIDEIKTFLMQWKTAWEKSAGEKGAVDALMEFYSEDFISNGVDKKGLHREFSQKNPNKPWIRIQHNKIHVNGPLLNGCYTAGFNQIYQSPDESDIAEQFLVLKKEPAGWKIIDLNPPITGLYPFSIHADSYRSKASARAAIDAYRQKGWQAYWTEVVLTEKGTWYRVYVGLFGNRKSAEDFIASEALQDATPLNTRYANLVGVYDSEKDLAPHQKLIVRNGYTPYVVESDSGRRLLYVGAYINLTNAEKFAAELKAKGILTQVVER